MSRTNPSPATTGDTTEKRTDEPTCPNNNPYCPRGNPDADPTNEYCFACFQALSRADERPTHVAPTPYRGF